MERNDHLDVLRPAPPFAMAPPLRNQLEPMVHQHRLQFRRGESLDPARQLDGDLQFDGARRGLDGQRFEIQQDRLPNICERFRLIDARRRAALEFRTPSRPLVRFRIFFKNHAPRHGSNYTRRGRRRDAWL